MKDVQSVIDEQLQALRQIAADRAANPRPAPAHQAPAPRPAPAPGAQLPIWPEAVRGVPNGFLRSALFGVVARGRRRYIAGEDIAALDGITIRYKGERLDQADLDVWESILHAVRTQALGSKCRLRSYALLKLMSKTDSGKNRATLQARIERLVANAVTIKTGRYTYIGGLIRSAARDDVTQEWVIELDERLAPMFAKDQFTRIDWAVRNALDGQPLAQWLHGFYSSHDKPHPMKVETLMRLCGSESELRRYRQSLGSALAAVAEASAAHGEGLTYMMRGDLVHVEKRSSGCRKSRA